MNNIKKNVNKILNNKNDYNNFVNLISKLSFNQKEQINNRIKKILLLENKNDNKLIDFYTLRQIEKNLLILDLINFLPEVKKYIKINNNNPNISNNIKNFNPNEPNTTEIIANDNEKLKNKINKLEKIIKEINKIQSDKQIDEEIDEEINDTVTSKNVASKKVTPNKIKLDKIKKKKLKKEIKK